MPLHEGMDEEPREAGGDEHSEENESEHQTPGRAFVGRRGCPGGRIFLRIGHCSVYGDGLPQRAKATKEARGGNEIGGIAGSVATQIQANGV